MIQRLLSAVLMLAATTAAAHAGERPVTMPTRDVDVTYAMSGSTLTQRIRWAAADGRLRVDPPRAGLYLVMDYHAKRLFAVRDAERAVLELNAGSVGVPGLGGEGTYARGEVAQVAGLACTEWTTRDAAGGEAEVCFTADGVMLQARRGERVLVEAARVTYGDIPPDVFQVPADYRRVLAKPQ